MVIKPEVLAFLIIMGKDKNIFRFVILTAAILIAGLCSCESEIDTGNGGDEVIEDKNVGSIIFNFPIPERSVPADKIHRIDLSVAPDAHSLYSGYFLESANVSDLLSSYSFKLEEGEYYYQAGLTCSAEGDTCLWDGFPGGQWGTKWTSGKIEIVKGEVIYKDLTFNK